MLALLNPVVKILDITDFNMMYSIFKNFDPDFVINCAAFTNVDFGINKQMQEMLS